MLNKYKIKYPKKDNKGRYLVYPILRSASKGERPNLVYKYKGYTPDKWGWVIKKEKLIEIDRREDLGWNRKGTPFRKYRPSEDRGTPIGNLWDDIARVGSGENLGYPTQKPEALLERIIKVSSNKGDIVLDPFCGCGTAIVVAHKLKRKWVGIDISPTACKLMLKRMKNLGVTTPIRDLPTSIKQLEKLHWGEFQNWVCEQLKGRVNPKKVGDMGIDGYMLGTIPIQVKQSHNIDRTNIDKFVGAMVTENKKKGVFVALSFTKGAIGHTDKLRMERDINIKLFIIKDLLEADFEPMKLFK